MVGKIERSIVVKGEPEVRQQNGSVGYKRGGFYVVCLARVLVNVEHPMRLVV